MLYVSYGVDKGGSTYTYCLIQAALETAGHAHIQLEGDGSLAKLRPRRPVNNIRRWDETVLAAASTAVPVERIVALRTHADPHPAVLDAVDAGLVQLSIAVRDPRDLALSMLDVATRRIGVEPKSHWTPIEPGNLESAFSAVDRTVGRALRWNRRSATVLYYEETAFRPQLTLARLCQQLALPPFSDADCEAIVRKAEARPYIKRNVAAPLRHTREMSASDQERILDRFAEYYDTFFPGADVALA